MNQKLKAHLINAGSCASVGSLLAAGTILVASTGKAQAVETKGEVMILAEGLLEEAMKSSAFGNIGFWRNFQDERSKDSGAGTPFLTGILSSFLRPM
jgi:hypothetical protein